MTTNTISRPTAADRPTAHGLCSHPATKAARSKCRRSKGATAHTVVRTMIWATDQARMIVEPCFCNGPAFDNICTVCDRPQI